MTDAGLLDEQLEYYRQRAAEYDEWWERRGRYDRGPEHRARWEAEIADVRRVFDALPFDGEVVELAPGTGYWTELLAARARRVTAIDGSAEMLAINRARLQNAAEAVDYRQLDLFEWEPDRRWDGLVFCFWISHVPDDRLEAFLLTCRRALRDGATMFFLDGQRDRATTAIDHELPDEDSEIMTRILNDGRRYRIVKNFWSPDRLVEATSTAGFDLEVHSTPTFFQFGVATTR